MFLLNFLLDLFFPIYCLGCEREKIWLCENCFKKIPLNSKSECPFCQKPSFFGRTCQKCQNKNLNGLIIASDYQNELLKKIIFSFKYKFIKELSSYLGELLISALKNHPLISSIESFVIIPVPLHWRRKKWRGFNQSELLAKKIEEYFSIPLFEKILIRKKHTKPQVKLKEKERKENIKNAFTIENPCAILNKKIILIDDVSTTGATLEECSKVLKKAGAKEIWGLVLARG